MPGIGREHRTNGSSRRLRPLLGAQPRWRGRRVPLDRALAEAEADVLAELETVRLGLVEAMAPLDGAGAIRAATVEAAYAEGRGRRSLVEGGVVALTSRRAASPLDLRRAMALLAILERTDRMMAQCVSIVTMRNLMQREAPPTVAQLECLMAMCELADEQIVGAGRVFVERDLVGLTRLRDRDRKLCMMNSRCVTLGDVAANGNGARHGSNMATLVARAIERIGEGAVGIGRQAAFVATGIAPPAPTGETGEVARL